MPKATIEDEIRYLTYTINKVNKIKSKLTDKTEIHSLDVCIEIIDERTNALIKYKQMEDAVGKEGIKKLNELIKEKVNGAVIEVEEDMETEYKA